MSRIGGYRQVGLPKNARFLDVLQAPVAGSGSEARADAGSRRLHALVPPSRLSLPLLGPYCPWQC